MTRKELVQKFFIEGYDKQNYDFVLNSLAPDYVDHIPAGARRQKKAPGHSSGGFWCEMDQISLPGNLGMPSKPACSSSSVGMWSLISPLWNFS